MTDPGARQLLETFPIFFVRDVPAAADYYRDKLGFRYDRLWGEPPGFIIVQRDTAGFMLRGGQEGGKPQPNRRLDPWAWDAYVYVRDADVLHAELVERGADIVRPPEDQFYGCRDFEVRDLDGYILCFGQDLPGSGA